MNISTVSSSQARSPQSTTSSTPKELDNDGDYDNGTGKDDAIKAQTLRSAAQPHLGGNLSLEA